MGLLGKLSKMFDVRLRLSAFHQRGVAHMRIGSRRKECADLGAVLIGRVSAST